MVRLLPSSVHGLTSPYIARHCKNVTAAASVRFEISLQYSEEYRILRRLTVVSTPPKLVASRQQGPPVQVSRLASLLTVHSTVRPEITLPPVAVRSADTRCHIMTYDIQNN
eukprot:scaffold44138_cov55-Attheya_sp.AAC.7